MTTTPESPGWMLTFDAASPTTSVAIGRRGEVEVVRRATGQHASERLLELIASALEEVRLTLSELEAIVTLSGPGRFTGLRVGLATAVGFQQAGHLRVGAISSWRALAAAAPPAEGEADGRLVTVIDAHRGRWGVRTFDRHDLQPEDEATLMEPGAMARFAPCTIVGFGVDRLQAEPALTTNGIEFHEPTELASAALAACIGHPPEFGLDALVRPNYLRPPAVETV